MSAISLSYFDFAGGRGEDCRIALHLAGVPFEDDRVKGANWPSRKPQTPFGSMPVLTVHGAALPQSNAILRYIGTQHGLHPSDPWEAARHDALMDYVEELRQQVSPTLQLSDPAEKKAAREALATGYIPTWASHVEAWLGEGPFLGGDTLNVADLKLFMGMNWFMKGSVDHIPADIFATFPKMLRLHEAVRTHPGVRSWYA